MIVTIIVGIFTLSMPSLVSTVWIPHKIRTSSVWNKASWGDRLSVSIESSKSKSSDSSLGEILRETLKDEQGMEVFMQWMFREFSSEALLSSIEFTQFKAVLMDYVEAGNGDQQNTAKGSNNLVFYPKIPKSTIVYGGIEQMESTHNKTENSGSDLIKLKAIADALYQKYIERECELELNISSRLRGQWDL